MTSTTQPLQISDLIFSNSKTDFNKLLGDLKRSTLSLQNRLRSIEQDASFVSAVAEAYGLPLIANERCGSWYIPPGAKDGSAYFKSTDGHMSQWSFSLRRLNLQVLEVVSRRGGCIIVDSTRRGKSMPDALSKTVPIWTCVMNRFLFPEATDFHDLRTPPNVIGASEHTQIASRIPAFVEAVSGLGLDVKLLKTQLKKPLRPIWVTQDSTLPLETPVFEDFYPIVCCTSSRRVPGGEASEGGYIQGAGDDAESWAHGLTPPLFWEHRDDLVKLSEEDLPGFIEQLVNAAGISQTDKESSILIKPTRFLHLGTLEYAESITSAAAFDIVITASQSSSASLEKVFKTRYLNLACTPGKLGSRTLRHELNNLHPFLSTHLPTLSQAARENDKSPVTQPKILVACPTGKDHSVGVALALLCLLCDHDGKFRGADHVSTERDAKSVDMSKQVIKQRLSWISVTAPEANPSRTTLQSVNAFLLG
ncbi:hypothetical protein AAFC00_002974 [Neodothiora populina]|uniref:Initiator tRNA phosphoribosyl transferase n=1 Tax=Neodothiora populina TaxID=2781224 RepID=A0ABR3P8U8_9PEZI